MDGNGRDIRKYPNGVIASDGEYRQGLKEGYWYGRHLNGALYFEEHFNHGRLLSGRSRTLEGETFTYDESSLFPIPEGGFENFNAYLKSETKKFGSDEPGHVKLSFRVTRTGMLTDLAVDQGASPTLNAKARDLIINGPRWLPPRIHGHEPVDGWRSVTVEFY